MEIVEHVPDIPDFLRVSGERLRPGGLFFCSTINRTLKAYALAIVGAERVLRWLPKGTHDWRKFPKPSELAAAMREASISPLAFEGVRYDVLRDRWVRCASLDVNYIVSGAKDQ
jgi:2-polyprenyl-6-hydroxyphenyl methylase/3-demethylubiquinone-9 3-methyltransferase